MIDMLALEIVFLAVLFALVVNTNWRRWKPRAGKLKKITVFLLIFAFLACAALWLWYDQDQRRQKAELFARQQAIDARRKRQSVLATLPRATPLTNPVDDLLPRADPGHTACSASNATTIR